MLYKQDSHLPSNYSIPASEANYDPLLLRRAINRLQDTYAFSIGRPRRRAILLSERDPIHIDPYFESKRAYFLERHSIPLEIYANSPVNLRNFGHPRAIIGAIRPGALSRLSRSTFDLNPAFPDEGWQWIRWINRITGHVVDVGRSQTHFRELKAAVAKRSSRVYVFGTGPSLVKAGERDWSDGVRIVCNTIVRDPLLWDKVRPDVIAAADGIYHFGCSEFARAFRADLRARLSTRPAFFAYPAEFDLIVQSELGEFQRWLIPIPVRGRRSIFGTLDEEFALPPLENVLNLMLLPLACSLSSDIRLWGFDGRAPGDADFWRNNERTFYPEHVAELKLLHPGFFAAKIPKGGEARYVLNVHGSTLEGLLQDAEKAGFTFQMLHFTHTETLASRYHVC